MGEVLSTAGPDASEPVPKTELSGGAEQTETDSPPTEGSEEVLYEAGNIKIVKGELRLSWYHFPWGEEHKWKLPIAPEALQEMTVDTFDAKAWGQGLSTVFWHFDGFESRFGKRAFVIVDEDYKSGFTPPDEDFEKVKLLLLERPPDQM